MEIHFSHVLRTAWISASSEKFQKHFEMFVFSHIFSLLWEFTFPIYWELYGFLLHPKHLRNFGMFAFFPHTFPVLWEFTFPMFWELYGFLLHPKFLRNPYIWNVCAFLYFSRIIEIQFSHVLAIPETLNFEMFMFSHIFPYSANSLFSYSGNCIY